MQAPVIVDATTAKALAQDAGVTAAVLANDRAKTQGGASHAAGPSWAAASQHPQIIETAPQREDSGDAERAAPLPKPPKGFDPYMMNGRGANDMRQVDEMAEKDMQKRGMAWRTCPIM